MNVFAKFDEIPSMILEVIKETKRYGQTVATQFAGGGGGGGGGYKNMHIKKPWH